jgi:hypothetical protein
VKDLRYEPGYVAEIEASWIIRVQYAQLHEGDEVVEITEKASEKIKDFLKERDVIPAIRLTLMQGG